MTVFVRYLRHDDAVYRCSVRDGVLLATLSHCAGPDERLEDLGGHVRRWLPDRGSFGIEMLLDQVGTWEQASPAMVAQAAALRRLGYIIGRVGYVDGPPVTWVVVDGVAPLAAIAI